MRIIPIGYRSRWFRLLALGILLVAPAACDTSEETHVDRAVKLRQAGDIQGAIWELHAAIRDDPANVELYRAEGSLYLETGDAPAAEFAFRKAIELGAADDETRLGLARALFAQEKHRETRDLLAGARPSSNHAEANGLKLEAMALDSLNDYPPAKRTFLILLKRLDRDWFEHADPLDTGAFIRDLEGLRDEYTSLDEALSYREKLANLPAGEWVTIHKQDVHDAVFFSRQNHGGSAFDTKRGRLMLFGSDTHDYGDISGKNWKNNVFFFDPALSEWTESYPRDPVDTFKVNDAGIPVAGENGDHPWPMHTYDAVSYDAKRDELVISSHPAHLEPGLFTYLLQSIWPQIRRHPTWVYDLSRNQWKALPTPAESFFLHATAYDSDRAVIIGYKTAGIFELAGEPRAWRQVVEGGFMRGDNSAVYDSKHKSLVIFGSEEDSNDIVVYEPATGRHQKMPTPTRRPPKGRFAPMAFHAGIGKTVVLVQRNQTESLTGGTTETWLYDLERDAWEQVETATLDSGIFRNYNLEYDPLHDFLLFVPNPYGPLSLTTVLALRLKHG